MFPNVPTKRVILVVFVSAGALLLVLFTSHASRFALRRRFSCDLDNLLVYSLAAAAAGGAAAGCGAACWGTCRWGTGCGVGTACNRSPQTVRLVRFDAHMRAPHAAAQRVCSTATA